MATMKEIDSFVYKFKQLLSNGFKASLSLEADRCDAILTLKAGIGLLSGYDHGCGSRTPRKRNGSYLRRQERRKHARQNNNVRAEKAQSFSSTSEVDGLEIGSDNNIHVNTAKAVQTEAEEAIQSIVMKNGEQICLW